MSELISVVLTFVAMALSGGPDPAVILGDRAGDVQRISVNEVVGSPTALPDGRLMIWENAGEVGQQRAEARYSTDNGLTWSKPQMLFKFPETKGSFIWGATLVGRNGSIHLFGFEYYDFDFNDRDKSVSYLWHARSVDGGKTWAPAQRVDFGFKFTGSSNNAFQLSSGRILVPVSAFSNRRTGVWVSVVPYSDDDGETWHRPVDQVSFNTGASDWFESGAAEPVGIELKDGRVWLLPRSQDGYQWESFSPDHGLHWDSPRHTRFVSNQSAMAVIRLKDGRILLIWDNCEPEGLGEVKWNRAERVALAAALSTDEGKTWVGYREVARVTKADDQVSYPYATQAGDGSVILYNSGGLVRFDPDFLTRTTFSENFAQGLGRWSTLAAEGAQVTADPDDGTARVLWLHKPNSSLPAAASLNFPFGIKGQLTITLRIERGFQGAHFTVTDHYALPGLPRDGSFPFRIEPNGQVQIIGSGGSWVATPGGLTPGKWHKVELKWNCETRQAELSLDGTSIAIIEQFVGAPGICYLRLRSTAAETDSAGMYVRSLTSSRVP